MNRIIDSHIHFWDVNRLDYQWMKPGTPLHRNFLPDDISEQTKMHGVEGYVVIEATNTSPEIAWLLQLVGQNPLIQGVVGGIDFTAPSVRETISEYAHNPVFKGVRLNWLQTRDNTAELAPSFQALAAHNLSCDVLNRFDLLTEVEIFAKSHPDVTFIINHMAGATFTPGGHTDWGHALRPLAALPNIAVKVSGFLTACDPKPLEPDTLWAYLETALEIFGSKRLMYASNFPINLLVSADYGDSVTLLQSVIGELSQDEQYHLWFGTAHHVYKLR
jgi:L-fuconolactonase